MTQEFSKNMGRNIRQSRFHHFSLSLPLPSLTLFFLTQIFLSSVDAHTGENLGRGGFSAGFSHPISGMDHILAMVSVGIWGAFLGPPSLWMLPIVFPLIMSAGAVYGILGFHLPFVEIGIALSVLMLGLAIMFKFKPHVAVSTGMVAFFGLFHGYAHGTELSSVRSSNVNYGVLYSTGIKSYFISPLSIPKSADALTYSVGFVLATGALHLIGIAVGYLAKFPKGDRALQGGGLVISGVGVYLLLKLISG